MKKAIDLAIDILRNAKHITAFTGAGISVESGIPAFRGKDGLWDKYDPTILVLDRYLSAPAESWVVVREIFYDFFGAAKPNRAHKVLARMEREHSLKAVITQNIDNLHQEAGSTNVIEFHGNSKTFVCTNCDSRFGVAAVDLSADYPKCAKCGGLLKPDFVFFGEGIPETAYTKSVAEAEKADVFLLIGSTGEVMPACSIPSMAKRNGVKIIEINPETSQFTDTITDIHLKGKAGDVLREIEAAIWGS